MNNNRIAYWLNVMDPNSSRHMLVSSIYGKEEAVRKSLVETPGVMGVYDGLVCTRGSILAGNSMVVGVETSDEEKYKKIADTVRNIKDVSYVTELITIKK